MNLPVPALSGLAQRRHATILRAPRPVPRRGFTLIEMLVALAVTLLMMTAVVTLFGIITDSVSNSRAGIEMSDRLRAARNRIQADLQGVTTTMTPPRRPEDDEGYFEIIEGSLTDYRNGIEDGTQDNADDHLLMFGDSDDVLMFTTRNNTTQFRGRYTPPGGSPTMIESPVAEVIYFLIQDGQVVDATVVPPARLFTLYRRVLLVTPSMPRRPPYATFYEENDISVRYEEPGGTATLIPNTLGDLTKRENRFAHYGVMGQNYLTHPFAIDLRNIPLQQSNWPPIDTSDGELPNGWPPDRTMIENAFLAPLAQNHRGDDVLLSNVLAFDVKVYDPGAAVRIEDDVPLVPSDPGWQGATDIASGAYVDLGYNTGVTTAFSGINPDQRPTAFSNGPNDYRVYDTWSWHYEADGVNQDGAAGTDGATNGLDDNGDGIVDDIGERDTLPPYNVPLRGIKITLRVYEPSSKQIREAVIIQDFVTER